MWNKKNLKNHWSRTSKRKEVLSCVSRTITAQYKNGRIPWNKGKKEGLTYQNISGFQKGYGWNRGKRYKNTVGYGNWKDGRTRNKKKYRKYLYYKDLTINRQKAIIHMHNRKSQSIKLTKEIFQRVYEDNIKRYGTLTCYLCLKPIKFGRDSLEHKIPLSRGGTNEYNNLAIAHLKCNLRKTNKTLEEYKVYVGAT